MPPSILFIPLAAIVFKLGLFDTRWALILTYPTFLIPFCTWLLMGYFRSIPYELEECALIDGATRWQILVKIVLPLAVPGLISAGIFAFTLSWNEFIYALTFVSSSEIKTVPVGVVTELVEGDVYHWGSLMAGALLGSLPVAFVYSFFVEYYVSGMTGVGQGVAVRALKAAGGYASSNTTSAAARAVPGVGDLWGGEKRSVGVGAHSALRSSDSPRLSERNERSEWSEFRSATPARASQRSRRLAPTATVGAHPRVPLTAPRTDGGAMEPSRRPASTTRPGRRTASAGRRCAGTARARPARNSPARARPIRPAITLPV